MKPVTAKLLDDVTITRPVILVLATGKTESDRNNNRGHLFERFIALLLADFGYENPTYSNFNVSSNGIELDVATSHHLTKQAAIAECKAYSKNLSAKELSAFYGKISAERFGHPAVVGFFIAIPGLTSDGEVLRKKLEVGDRGFHVVTSEEIFALLKRQTLIADPPGHPFLRSDLAVIITQHGTYSAAKVLDPKSRLAAAVHVWGVGPVPDPVLELIRESDYAAGLPVATISGQPQPHTPVSIPPEPTIVEVVGSKSELEYQLPASPRFFVGRREHVRNFDRRVEAGIETGQVVVLNGQSGWGKSSLALQFKNVVQHRQGHATVIDSRTASSPEFVWQSIRRSLIAAEKYGLVKLPDDASYASLNSTVATIRRAEWGEPASPLMIFFDQFENVFRDVRLTQEFRDLSLAIRDVAAPVIVGFAWKTDLVGLTDPFPYQLRDDIRSCADVYVMEPLGPGEINTLLRRLEKTAEEEFQKDLKQRLREVSQGLPWLFKKLASHVVRELGSGMSQDDLVSESLNVKRLFERDLAELVTHEREALKKIARLVPRSASEIVELVPGAVVQSLLDRRLIVRVGELLDTYWDIFRDFLITGEVIVAETYILRQTPSAVGKLLREVINSDGDLTAEDAAKRLNLALGVIFNLSRELRVMGVLTDRPRHVHVSEDILSAPDREAAIREKVSSSLKKHKVFSMLKEMVGNAESAITLATFAEALPRVFPAIPANQKVWRQYARVFVNWLEYAEMASLTRTTIDIPPVEPVNFNMLTDSGKRPRHRTKGKARAFPSSPPRPALQIAEALARQKPIPPLKAAARSKALTDLIILGIIAESKPHIYSLAINPFDGKYKVRTDILQSLIDGLPGARDALKLVKRNPAASTDEVGEALRMALDATWTNQTLKLMGKNFRGWARAAGIRTMRNQSKKKKARGAVDGGQ